MKLKRVKVKNFKSFLNEEFNFDTKTNTNYIYGSNGVGKTTFINIFDTLGLIFTKETNLWNISKIPPHFRDTLNDPLAWDIYSPNVTVGSDDEMLISVTFTDIKKDLNIEYTIGLIKGDIVTQEKMSVVDNDFKDKKILFEKRLNDYIDFNNDELGFVGFKEGEITKNTTSSILSLLFLRMSINENNADVEANEYFFALLKSLLLSGDNTLPEIKSIVANGIASMPKDTNIINKIEGISSYKDRLEIIEKYIKSFETFVMSIDKSIRGVEIMTLGENSITYDITYKFIKDLGGGKTVDVPYYLESEGTRKYMRIFNSIYNIQQEHNSNVIFIDEIGSNLHEELIIKISNYINKYAHMYDKHVFITTHHSILLNDKYVNRMVPKNSNKEKYFMNRTIKGRVLIDSLKNTNIKENNQAKFLAGLYGASPDILGVYTDKDE